MIVRGFSLLLDVDRLPTAHRASLLTGCGAAPATQLPTRITKFFREIVEAQALPWHLAPRLPAGAPDCHPPR